MSTTIKKALLSPDSSTFDECLEWFKQQHWDFHTKTVTHGIRVHKDLYGLLKNKFLRDIVGITDETEVANYLAMVQDAIFDRQQGWGLSTWLGVDSQRVKAHFGNDYRKRLDILKHHGFINIDEDFVPDVKCKKMKVTEEWAKQIDFSRKNNYVNVMPPKRYFKQAADHLRQTLADKETDLRGAGEVVQADFMFEMVRLNQSSSNAYPMYIRDKDGGGRSYTWLVQSKKTERPGLYSAAGLDMPVEIDMKSAHPLMIVHEAGCSDELKSAFDSGDFYEHMLANGEFTDIQKAEQLELGLSDRAMAKIDACKAINTTVPGIFFTRNDLLFRRIISDSDAMKIQILLCELNKNIPAKSKKNAANKWLRTQETKIMNGAVAKALKNLGMNQRDLVQSGYHRIHDAVRFIQSTQKSNMLVKEVAIVLKEVTKKLYKSEKAVSFTRYNKLGYQSISLLDLVHNSSSELILLEPSASSHSSSTCIPVHNMNVNVDSKYSSNKIEEYRHLLRRCGKEYVRERLTLNKELDLLDLLV